LSLSGKLALIRAPGGGLHLLGELVITIRDLPKLLADRVIELPFGLLADTLRR
jgi:hypothetical protein